MIQAVTKTNIPTMDGEHRVQVGLIHAICDSVEKGADSASIGTILDHLLNYSIAHFMSEELLMRLVSYDGFEEHVADHARMIDALKLMKELHRSGKSELVVTKAREILAFLLCHIETRDAEFAVWERD